MASNHLATNLARISLGVICAAVCTVANAAAPDSQPPADSAGSQTSLQKPLQKPSQKPSLTQRLDQIWGYATLYDNDEDNDENPVLEKFALRGRFQVDFPLFEANHGGDFDEVRIRRFRLGFKSRWFEDFTLHTEVDVDVDCNEQEGCDGDNYQGFTDAYVGWSPNDRLALKLGKISAPFTLDGSTSSTRLITLERNNLTNNLWFPVEYHSGVGASGRIDESHYKLGVYSSNGDKEFGDFDGGYFTLVTLAHDFSKQLGVREFVLSLDYVYNKSDDQNTGTRELSHVVSVHLRFDTERWGLRSDFSGGVGYHAQSDLIGLALMPFYHITDDIQLVGRYTFLHSFDDDGIRYSRYESRIVEEPGDRYDEIFVGLNWFVYGHKLKLQSGFKYTWMDAKQNYRGWGWTTGLRISW
jgi:phosphate-selective porin OprO/OprP